MRDKKIKVILCGGGTGGHIFPMISIADEIKKRNLKNEVLLKSYIDTWVEPGWLVSIEFDLNFKLPF